MWAKISMTLALMLLGSGCSLSYVLKQGYYQAKLICGSEPISEVLESDEVPVKTAADGIKEMIDIANYAMMIADKFRKSKWFTNEKVS